MNQIENISSLNSETINYERCLAIVNGKNKDKTPRQCFNKHLDNSTLCGVHSKVKKVITADVFWKKQINENTISNSDKKKPTLLDGSEVSSAKDERGPTKKLKLKILGNEPEKNLPTLALIKKWRIQEIRQHILSQNIKINIKQKKEVLCEQLGQYYITLNKYTQYLPQITLIQALIRGKIVRGRNKCVNKEDVYTMESIYDIPIRYFFQFKDKEGFQYGFDIRSFKSMMDALPHGKLPSNPYTLKELPPEVLVNYQEKLTGLMASNIGLEKIDDMHYELTPEKELELYMVSVFHKFDMLDNYTDYRWFQELSMLQLKKLYKECEDIWNYRANLPNSAKNALVKGGIAFNHSMSKILTLQSTVSNILMLQKIILKEFERFADEGATEGDKKTGAKLMLAALTCVSTNAANAYPYLVWSMAPSD